LAVTVRQCHLIFDEVGTDRLCLSAVTLGGSIEGPYQILNLGCGRSVEIIGVNIMQCLSGAGKPSAASNDYSHRSLLKKSRGSCPGSNAALWRLRRMSFPSRPYNAKDATELPQGESGIRKELQAELADHSVKASVAERQCLTISGYRQKRRVVQSTARTFDHRQGDVRTDHRA
jgi:hypothetical protein